MTLTTPTYNFVRFDELDLFRLIIMDGDTIAFQVRIDDIGIAADWGVTLKDNENNSITLSNKSIVKEGVLLNVSFKITGELTYTERYRINLQYSDGVTTDVFTSNVLVKSNIITNVFKYKHFEDFMDLGYETTSVLFNQVRLPIRLYNHTPSTVTEQYQRSTGQFVSFGTFVNDIYEVTTPHLIGVLHRCIQAMFLHRTIQTTIDSELYNIQLSESYQLEYPDNNNYGLAKAKTKISASLA